MADVLSQNDIKNLLMAISTDDGNESENSKRCKYFSFAREGNNINRNVIGAIKEKISPAVEQFVNLLAKSTNKKLKEPYTSIDFIHAEETFRSAIGPYNYLRVINVNDCPVFVFCDTKIMDYIILDEKSIDYRNKDFSDEQQFLADKFIYNPLFQCICNTNPNVNISSSDKIYDFGYLINTWKDKELLNVTVEVQEDRDSSESCFLTFIAPEKSWFNFIGENYPVENHALSLLNENICEKYNSFVIFAETNLNEKSINGFKAGDVFYTDEINHYGKPGKLIVEKHHICNGDLCLDGNARDDEFYFYVKDVIPSDEKTEYFYHNKNNLFVITGLSNQNKLDISQDDLVKLGTSICDDFYIVYKNKIIALCNVDDITKKKFKISVVLENPVSICK